MGQERHITLKGGIIRLRVEAGTQYNDKIKVLKRKTANLEFFTQQKYSSIYPLWRWGKKRCQTKKLQEYVDTNLH